jgi:hypothetical protein
MTVCGNCADGDGSLSAFGPGFVETWSFGLGISGSDELVGIKGPPMTALG